MYIDRSLELVMTISIKQSIYIGFLAEKLSRAELKKIKIKKKYFRVYYY